MRRYATELLVGAIVLISLLGVALLWFSEDWITR